MIDKQQKQPIAVHQSIGFPYKKIEPHPDGTEGAIIYLNSLEDAKRFQAILVREGAPDVQLDLENARVLLFSEPRSRSQKVG